MPPAAGPPTPSPSPCQPQPRVLADPPSPPGPLHAPRCTLHSIYLQVVGERRSTRTEERVLHFDLNYGAIKFVAKEALKLTVKLDVVNQVIFDESEPRSILISCHDDRRYLIDFQNAEENLVFR